jgi:hypothetical protein
MNAKARARLQAAFMECERMLIRNEVRAGRMGYWDGWCRLYNMGFRGHALASAARAMQ